MTDKDTTDDIAERIASSIRDQRDGERSRRGFVTKSALAGGTLLALGSGTGIALGSQDDGQGADDGAAEDGGEETTAAFDDVEGTDVDVLNYALSLEHLEDAFYAEALDTYDETAFVEAEALQAYDEAEHRAAYGNVQTMGEHESTHVDVLSQAVTLLGAEPAMAGTYDFGIESVGDVRALGQVVENTGVAAYAGAAPFVESPDLLSTAPAIHSVEARHAAVLNQYTDTSPFPDAFDPALAQSDVLDAVSGFIVDSEGTPGDGSGTPDDGTDAPGDGTDAPGDGTDARRNRDPRRRHGHARRDRDPQRRRNRDGDGVTPAARRARFGRVP